MDIKKALAILNLKADACLEDARDSFRSLAKKYHPDKLNITCKTTGHDKMQDINLAFHLLKKILKPKKKIKPKQCPSKQKKPEMKKKPAFQEFTDFLRKIHKRFFKSGKTKNIQKGEEPSKESKSTNRSNGSKNYVKKESRFDSVLNKTIKSSINVDLRKPDTIKFKQKVKIKNSYSKYMELKQKMHSKRKDTRLEGISSIEKINPISPITKI
jgi:curved DNA-binding protein CbpA